MKKIVFAFSIAMFLLLSGNGTTYASAAVETCQHPDGDVVTIDWVRHTFKRFNQQGVRVDSPAADGPQRWVDGGTGLIIGRPGVTTMAYKYFRPGTIRYEAGIHLDVWDIEEGHWVSYQWECR